MSEAPWSRVPEPVRAVLETLGAAGFEGALVGGCVRDLAVDRPVRDWDVATAAPAEEVLALFPRAVPIGLRFGTVMVPTAAGPVDVTRFRGATLRADLARRDFTLNALALRVGDREPFDPEGGLADLRAGRLRAVGSPAERLAEDPLRALRAARFVAELDLETDAALRAALPDAAGPVLAVAAERIRAELERLLAGVRAERGIALLRETGLEAALLPGARPDAAAVVAALPADDPTLRWTAWLRGVEPSAPRRLRLPRQRQRDVAALLAHHPVERAVPAREVPVRRLLHRLGERGVERLVALRQAELDADSADAPARQRFEALRAALERVRARGTLALVRADLALGGGDVMAILGCGPGPRVGRALHHLTECVLEDPSSNTRELLRAELLAWSRRGEPASQDPP